MGVRVLRLGENLCVAGERMTARDCELRAKWLDAHALIQEQEGRLELAEFLRLKAVAHRRLARMKARHDD